MKVVLFEDYDYVNFYPLSLTRPVFRLRSGIGTLEDKVRFHFPTVSFSYIIRDNLKGLYRGSSLFDFGNEDEIIAGEDYLFILSNLVLDRRLDIGLDQVLMIGGKVVSFRVRGSFASVLREEFFFEEGLLSSFLLGLNLEFMSSDMGYRCANYLFDLISCNATELVRELMGFEVGGSVCGSGVIVEGDVGELFLGEGVKVYGGVCFILDGGSIFVDAGACIKPFSVIEGPCYIGRGSVIEGAKIGGGTSIGAGCKLGGEVSNSIIMDYTNKHHEGFLGNSYIGSFVNFGAMATTSDLKNNYGLIKVLLRDRLVETSLIKLGSFVGDHSKLGIGSLVNTGTVIGVGCNLYFEGLMYPKYVPSFLWGARYPFSEYIFERFINTTKVILGRRSQVLTEEYISLFMWIYEFEKKSRKSFLEKIS